MKKNDKKQKMILLVGSILLIAVTVMTVVLYSNYRLYPDD